MCVGILYHVANHSASIYYVQGGEVAIDGGTFVVDDEKTQGSKKGVAGYFTGCKMVGKLQVRRKKEEDHQA